MVVDTAALAAVPGVRAVVARNLGCVDLVPGGDSSECGDIFIGSCAQLVDFTSGVTGCRDDQVAWIDVGGEGDLGATATAPRFSVQWSRST